MGRDNGYPQRKFKIIETVDDLVKTYDAGAEYYNLEKVDVSGAVEAFNRLSGAKD